MRYLNIHPAAVRAGRTLLLTLAAAATSLGAATSAVASPTAETAAAPGPAASTSATGAGSHAAWSYIRLTCRSVAAGQVCLGLMGNGQPSNYRLQYVIRPKAGQWIRRVALASWQPVVEDSTEGPLPGTSLRSDGYRQLCAGPCPVYWSNASWLQSTPYFRVYTFLFDTPQGRYDVSAGATVPGTEPDGTCRLLASSQLTTTSDGNVWLRRDFGLGLLNPMVARLIENGRSVYTKTWSGNDGDIAYDSPQLYRPWDRVRNPDGSWSVAGPSAYAFYRDYDGEVRKIFTNDEATPPC